MKTLKLISLFAALAASAFAVPVTLKLQEASNLYSALSSIKSGLSPLDVMAAADDMNVLYPKVQPFQKGQQDAARQASVLPDGAGKMAAQIALLVPMEAKGEDTITVDLTLIDLSQDEVKAMTVADPETITNVVSQLRRFLAPPPPKK
jgi:hypothetical protein